MRHSEIRDKLVLLYRGDTGALLGTGFIVNESGYFVTAYHNLTECGSIKDNVRCLWRDEPYTVRYIESLGGYYQALRDEGEKFPSDLTILQLHIHNKSFVAAHFPVLTFEIGEELAPLSEVAFSGFDCERLKNRNGAEPSTITANLAKFQEAKGFWLSAGGNNVSLGYSGSPVLHPQFGEVMGVVVQRSREDKREAAVRSLHMLINELKFYDRNCEHFFRSPHSLYGKYHDKTCRSFEKEIWPYAIDKKEFVDAFDFKTGHFPVKNEWGEVKRDERVVPFIVQQLKEHPVFCVGYYGMGKTTISKFLFSEYSSYSKDECPVFVSMPTARLSALNSDDWPDFVAGEMCKVFKPPTEGWTHDEGSDEFVRLYFKHFVIHNKVVVIFDGIDEAPHQTTSLDEFAEVLKSLPCTYLLTSRREFHAFFDVFGSHMLNHRGLVVELMPWEKKQWQKYIKNLSEKYPDKRQAITRLDKALENHEYKSLAERPLFLKMISDLELGNKTELDELPRELKGNKAAVYNVYVRWKTRDEWARKRRDVYVDKIWFPKRSFRLFCHLADIEYERSVPKGGAAELLGRDIHDSGTYTYAGFTIDDIQSVCTRFSLFDPKFVEENFSLSTLFSLIRRDVREEQDGQIAELFRFSHKSFCEYLVAYNLANSILGGTVEEATCGRAWDLYQTCEVSALFQDEVKRIISVKRLQEGEQKPYFQKAFEKVLLAERDWRHYVERFEQVLYYTGKFGVASPQIFDVLEPIASDPKTVHAIYYRTAHLSLSLSKGVEYCLKYVEHLIESFNGDKEAFQWNTDIQINYYGKGNLHSAMKEDVDKFISDGRLEGIVPLEVFSYFVCLPFDRAEIDSAREYLCLVGKTCQKRGYTRMGNIVNQTQPILESVRFSHLLCGEKPIENRFN